MLTFLKWRHLTESQLWESIKWRHLTKSQLWESMQEMGYTDVRNLGRLQDWIEAGGEVEKG